MQGESRVVTRKAVWQAFGILVLAWLPLAWLDMSLRNPALPAGILSFEMIATTPRAQAALASWDATARTHALWSVGWDFAFMFTYGLWMSRLARYGGHRLASRSRIVSGWAGIAAGAAWVGVALDAVENVALLVVLLHSTAQPWPAIATVAASIKFFCLICSLFYGLTALLAAMMPEDEALQVRPPRP